MSMNHEIFILIIYYLPFHYIIIWINYFIQVFGVVTFVIFILVKFDRIERVFSIGGKM